MNGLLPRERSPGRLAWSMVLLVASSSGMVSGRTAQASPLRHPHLNALQLEAQAIRARQAQAQHLHAQHVLAPHVAAEQLLSARQATAVAPPVHGPGVFAWENYISHGPAFWLSVHAPAITPAVASWMYSTVREADPFSDPMTDYLYWRWSLAPARFNFYHPWLGPALGNLTPPSSPTGPGTGPSGQGVQPENPFPPPSSSSGSNPPAANPPGDVPPAIPEPGTLWIALSMLATAAWGHRQRRAA
jgi:hypothetical protein